MKSLNENAMTELPNEQFLDFTFESSDLGTITVREYFKTLLLTLWHEGEGFSGKRPFGNSGWEYDLYRAAILFDKKYGNIDDYGDITYNKNTRKFITDTIDFL